MIRPAFITLILLGALFCRGHSNEACSSSSDDPRYDFQLALDGHMSLYWKLKASTIKFKVEYDSNAWVSFGSSDSSSGNMIGSEVVLGLPNVETVRKYELTSESKSGVDAMSAQTLTHTNISQVGGITTISYTKLLVESGEIEILSSGDNNFVWAYGSSNSLAQHTKAGSLQLDLSSCNVSNAHSENSNGNAYLIHGALMVVGWTYLIPAGVLSAIFKFFIGPVWIKLHFFFELSGFILVLCSFFFILSESNEEEEEGHGQMGIIVVILGGIQVCLGLIRPEKKPGALSEYTGDAGFIIQPQSTQRRFFDVAHRCLGFVVIVFAFLTIHSGIEAADEEGYVEKKKLDRLWAAAAIPFALLVVSAVIYRLVSFGIYFSTGQSPLKEDSTGLSDKKMDRDDGL